MPGVSPDRARMPVFQLHFGDLVVAWSNGWDRQAYRAANSGSLVLVGAERDATEATGSRGRRFF